MKWQKLKASFSSRNWLGAVVSCIRSIASKMAVNNTHRTKWVLTVGEDGVRMNVGDPLARIPAATRRAADNKMDAIPPRPAAVRAEPKAELPAVAVVPPTKGPREIKKITARRAEGAAAVKAGGTKELHSRSGRVALTKP